MPLAVSYPINGSTEGHIFAWCYPRFLQPKFFLFSLIRCWRFLIKTQAPPRLWDLAVLVCLC